MSIRAAQDRAHFEIAKAIGIVLLGEGQTKEILRLNDNWKPQSMKYNHCRRLLLAVAGVLLGRDLSHRQNRFTLCADLEDLINRRAGR